MQAVTDPQTRASYLNSIPPFRSSAQDLMEIAGPKIRCAVYERGERVYSEVDESAHVFGLYRGRVRTLRITPQGKDVTLYLVEPGQLFGVDSLVRGDSGVFPWGHDAEVVDNQSVVVSIPQAEFGVIAARRPELMNQVMRCLWSQAQDLMDQAETRAFLDVRGRLAHVLLMLAYKEGIPSADGMILCPVLTHEELAALAGTRRESGTTALGIWRREGIIAPDDGERSLLLMDVERLGQFREGGTSAQMMLDSIIQRLSEVHDQHVATKIAAMVQVRERRGSLAGIHPALDLFVPGSIGRGQQLPRNRT